MFSNKAKKRTVVIGWNNTFERLGGEQDHKPRRSIISPAFVVLLPTPGKYCHGKSIRRFAMTCHADQQQLEELHQVIERSPAQCVGALARKLNWSREKVTRGLVTLNDRGVLLYEDDHG